MKFVWQSCCIFQPAFGFCAPQTLVEIVIFSIYCAKKLQKRKKVLNLMQKLAKKVFFKFASKRWSSVLFPTLRSSPRDEVWVNFTQKWDGVKLKNIQDQVSCLKFGHTQRIRFVVAIIFPHTHKILVMFIRSYLISHVNKPR